MNRFTRSAVRLFTVSALTVVCVQMWALAVSAAEPNHPSVARAQLANQHAPMACVVRTVVAADGSIHRISACEATQAGWHAFEEDCHREPLANGRAGETVRVCDKVRLVRF